MKTLKRSVIAAVVPFLVLCASAISGNEACAGDFQAGTAKANITPPVPIPMSGYSSRTEPYESIHDSLYLRVVTFGDGERNAAVITADVIGLSHDFWEDVIGRVERETGIKREYVLIAPVHNHGGPVTMVYNRDVGPEVKTYMESIKAALVASLKTALGNMKPVAIGCSCGECLMNVNRRARHPNGTITLGRNPYGPCDKEVGVISVTTMDGKPLAVLFNWSCHGVVTGPDNLQITGDWPGAAERRVETMLGDGVIAPVTIGASGDINPIYGPHTDYSFGVEAVGNDLGDEVMRVMKEIEPVRTGRISAAQRTVTLPGKTDDAVYQQPQQKDAQGVMVRLTVLKIGTVVLAGFSGELFNEIGSAVKEKSPYRDTFLVTHCNGSSGYFVTDATHEEGGYEARSTRAKPGAEHIIVSELLAMINEVEGK